MENWMTGDQLRNVFVLC